MEKDKIDINTFISRLIEKTNQDSCQWEDTSQIFTYRLILPSGCLIYNENHENSNDYYNLTLKDSNNKAFAYYSANPMKDELLKPLSELGTSIEEYFSRIRERKIAEMFSEL